MLNFLYSHSLLFIVSTDLILTASHPRCSPIDRSLAFIRK